MPGFAGRQLLLSPLPAGFSWSGFTPRAHEPAQATRGHRCGREGNPACECMPPTEAGPGACTPVLPVQLPARCDSRSRPRCPPTNHDAGHAEQRRDRHVADISRFRTASTSWHPTRPVPQLSLPVDSDPVGQSCPPTWRSRRMCPRIPPSTTDLPPCPKKSPDRNGRGSGVSHRGFPIGSGAGRGYIVLSNSSVWSSRFSKIFMASSMGSGELRSTPASLRTSSGYLWPPAFRKSM